MRVQAQIKYRDVTFSGNTTVEIDRQKYEKSENIIKIFDFRARDEFSC